MWWLSIWYIWLPVVIAFWFGEHVLAKNLTAASTDLTGFICAAVMIIIIVLLNWSDVSTFIVSIFDEPPKHPGAMDYVKQRQ